MFREVSKDMENWGGPGYLSKLSRGGVGWPFYYLLPSAYYLGDTCAVRSA